MMNERYGAKAEPMLALYRSRYPNKSPFLIQAQIATDAGFRRNAILQAERKSALGQGSRLHVPVGFRKLRIRREVRRRSRNRCFGLVRQLPGWHRRNGVAPGEGVVGRFASAWVSLAKTGNPNNPKIPNWPAYDVANASDHDFR